MKTLPQPLNEEPILVCVRYNDGGALCKKVIVGTYFDRTYPVESGLWRAIGNGWFITDAPAASRPDFGVLGWTGFSRSGLTPLNEWIECAKSLPPQEPGATASRYVWLYQSDGTADGWFTMGWYDHSSKRWYVDAKGHNPTHWAWPQKP